LLSLPLQTRQKTGEEAYPFDELYWHFLVSREKLLRLNPGMGLACRNLFNQPEAEIGAIVKRSEQFLKTLNQSDVQP